MRTTVAEKLIVISLFCCLGCTTAEQPSALRESLASAQLTAYHLSWPPPKTATQLQTTLRQATGAFLRTPLLDADVTVGGPDWWAPVASSPSLMAAYDADHDTIRLSDFELLATPAPPSDIGASGAKQAALAFMGDLANQGLIDPANYDFAGAMSLSRHSGYGNMDGTNAKQWIAEYTFVVPRILNGIPVGEADLVLGIHCSGKRSSLRLGGVQVDSSGVGSYSFTRSVSAADAQTRFQALFPGARIINSRLMYLMPKDGTRGAIVEPTETIFFNYTSVGEQGQTAVSFVEAVGFSSRDLAVPPQNYLRVSGAVPGPDQGVAPRTR